MNNRRPSDDRYWDETFDEWVGRIWKKIFKGLALFVIIALGVTCGNLASNYISVYVAGVVAEREAKEAMGRLNEKMERLKIEAAEKAKRRKEELERLNAQRAREDAERKAQQGAREAITKKRRETCLFWEREYRKTGKELDMLHRDKACRDAGISVH